MTALTAFKESKAWDKRHDLPLVPQHNNPMIYSAYATKIIKICDGIKNPFVTPAVVFVARCEVKKGLYNRWPDGSGGVNSHDELMGIAYHSTEFAKKIAAYLDTHKGIYNNADPDSTNFRYCLHRFPWLMPYLRSRAGVEISRQEQLLFESFLFVDAFTYKGGDEGGRLRIWLMLGEMNNYPHVAQTIDRWKGIMKNVHKLSPKKCFETYLKEVPEFRKYAPEEF